jgi:hypothetical protein
MSPWELFWNPKVFWLALNYFCVVTASVGMLLQTDWLFSSPFAGSVFDSFANLVWASGQIDALTLGIVGGGRRSCLGGRET